MKEATGELSTTVIAVVAIAAIASLFIVFLYPQLKASIILNNACQNGPGYEYTDPSYTLVCDGDSISTTSEWTCTYEEGDRTQTKTCNQGS